MLKGLKAEGIKSTTKKTKKVRGLEVMKELKAEGIGLRLRLRKFGVRSCAAPLRLLT